jgi:CheY-like chemotaxis protein
MTIKMLVADDSITIQKVIGLTFANEDLLIESASDGNRAMELAQSLRPDLVLADIDMPGQNGYEVCANIKQDPQLAHTRVVLMVGTFETFNEEEAARVGCDGHIVKPFDTSELTQLVHSLVPHGDNARAQSGVAHAAPEICGYEGNLSMNDAAGLLSQRTRESFMGSHRILDLFEPVTGTESGPSGDDHASTGEAAKSGLLAETQATLSYSGEEELVPSVIPEAIIDQIVEKVIGRMSQDIIREIAWEVVPELSEAIIRQCLEENARR